MGHELLERLNAGMTSLAKTNPSIVRNMVTLSEDVAQDNLLTRKTKKLIFVALAVSQRCEFCIAHHAHDALQAGATKAEIIEAAQVAVAMGGGPNLAYLVTVLQEILSTYEENTLEE
jgi:AhpD family alkylhydroperoxidase